nr:MAG TPA: hypothetical protein [Caudoviricetes sp.]
MAINSHINVKLRGGAEAPHNRTPKSLIKFY